MKKYIFALAIVAFSSLHAEGTKVTAEDEKADFYSGAVMVNRVYIRSHVEEWQQGDPKLEPEAVSRRIKLTVLEDGGASNPLVTALLSRGESEGDANPGDLHKLSLGALNQINSVTVRSAALPPKSKRKQPDGSYVIVTGTRQNPTSGKISHHTIKIKFTDAKSNYLDELVVTEK